MASLPNRPSTAAFAVLFLPPATGGAGLALADPTNGRRDRFRDTRRAGALGPRGAAGKQPGPSAQFAKRRRVRLDASRRRGVAVARHQLA